MQVLPLENVTPVQRKTATYAAAVLSALAREERLGRRPLRLLEPGMASWSRFKGHLGRGALLEILLEDAAISQAIPFGIDRVVDAVRFQSLESSSALADASLGSVLWGEGQAREEIFFLALTELSDEHIARWFALLPELDLLAPSADYVLAQAKLLGLPTRLARSELHRLKPHHRVLELPGTGGQLAHHVATTQENIYLQDVFTLVCSTWQELVMAGLVCVELGISGIPPIRFDPKLEVSRLERGRYNYVFGRDPDQGGEYSRSRLKEMLMTTDAEVNDILLV